MVITESLLGERGYGCPEKASDRTNSLAAQVIYAHSAWEIVFPMEDIEELAHSVPKIYASQLEILEAVAGEIGRLDFGDGKLWQQFLTHRQDLFRGHVHTEASLPAQLIQAESGFDLEAAERLASSLPDREADHLGVIKLVGLFSPEPHFLNQETDLWPQIQT